MESYLLIVNPAAGRGRTGKIFPCLQAHLQAQKISYEFHFTSEPGEAMEMARKAVREGFTHIVAVGGDGTVQEVARGLIGSHVILGIIPTGGGNDFCKAVGVPLELTKSIEALACGRSRRVDMGRLGERYFINGLGIGLDGAVAHRYRQMRHLRGKLGYLWGAVHEALTFRAIPIKLTAPDLSLHETVLLTSISNGPHLGGSFKLSPQAKIDDGLLDLCVIGDMPPLLRLLQIPKVQRGTHLSLREVQVHRAPWVEIHSECPLPAHMDGEPFELEAGRHKIEVIPQVLEVIVPL